MYGQLCIIWERKANFCNWSYKSDANLLNEQRIRLISILNFDKDELDWQLVFLCFDKNQQSMHMTFIWVNKQTHVTLMKRFEFNSLLNEWMISAHKSVWSYFTK